MRGCLVGKPENFDISQKGAQCRFILLLPGRNFDTVNKFGLRNHRDADLADRNFLQALQQRVMRALHQGGANISVQHVTKHYTARSCTGRSSSMKLDEATADSAR